MPQHALRVVESRDAYADALVEQARPPSSADGPSDESVDLVCGGCGAVVWRRPAPPEPGTQSVPERSAESARRVLIECAACGALNVLPAADA